ncbi:MAG: hypothetical protein K1W16_12185 [Lachnospiraceae bacterium]|jgi:hypothetical protein
MEDFSLTFFIAVNADEKSIIDIVKIRKDFGVKSYGRSWKRMTIGRNNIEIEQNEDYDKNLSLNNKDAFLYYQSNMYFYPYENTVTVEEQIQLAKDICKTLKLSGISSEIVAEFEELL